MNNSMIMKILLAVGVVSLKAMDELPPTPTEQELQSEAVSEGINIMLPTFLLTLPAVALGQYIVTMPASSAVCAATLAALEGVRMYHKVRHPSPALVKWKQLVALRPRIINEIGDVVRELNLRADVDLATTCPRLGLVKYLKLCPTDNADYQWLVARGLKTPVPEKLSNLTALCLRYQDQKVPASALALHFAKRQHKLEGYRDAMINLAPYKFPATGPLMNDPLPKISLFDRITTYGCYPEDLEGIMLSQAVMRSCNAGIAALADRIRVLREAMGA